MKKGKPVAVKEGKVNAFSPDRNLLWIILIPLLIIIVYRSVTDYQLVDWDDKRYLKETPMIQGLTMDNVKSMFTTKVLLSYNPFVLITFAIDYEIAKLSPGWCHGVNVFFHIMNALILFFCLKKLKLQNEVVGIIACIFAIHPMSVEAVAWIAGRKDVVYGFFYLLSWLFYMKFINSSKKISYGASIIFFVFALFSKVQAITLPFVLIITDYMLISRFRWKSLLNKIPFFTLSLIFGLAAISGSTLVADKYTLPPTFMDKIIYSVMGFGIYFQKILLPFHQTCMYTFPVNGSGEYFTLLIIGILAIGVVATGVIYSWKKAPMVTGGLLFFLFSIFPVLHIVAFNSALIYERFTYLAGIGIFISLMNLDQLFPVWKESRLKVAGAVTIIFAVLAMMRVGIWKNAETMWSDVTEKSPRAAEAFNNLGMVYLDKGEFDKATVNFNECIRLKPQQPDPYNNLSVIAYKKNNLKEALRENLVVLNIDTNHVDGNKNRGVFYFNMSQWDSAIYYYSKVTRIIPKDASSYFYIACAYYNKGEYRNAIDNCNKAIKLIPDYADAFVFMGMSYARFDRIDSVMYCVNSAENASALSAARLSACQEYLKMGSEAYAKKDSQKALYYYIRASEVMPTNAETYYNIGGIYISMQDVNHARENWRKAVAIDPNHQAAKEWLQRIGG